MGWKSWPYWVKGGIIVTFLWIIAFLIINIGIKAFGAVLIIWGAGAIILQIFDKNCSLLAGFGGETSKCLLGQTGGISYTIFLILSNLIIYFIIGAIIGWIIGKIKSKK